MKNHILTHNLALLCMQIFLISTSGLSQNNDISWQTLGSAFGIPASGNTAVKLAVGQMVVGAPEQSNIKIQSGFLADTLLQGPLLAVSEKEGIPLVYSLSQNYPNPFNPTTDIRFQIADGRLVTLKIYDVLGREVTTLVDEVKQPGTYSVRWDASRFTSGVYFCRITAGRFIDTRKILYMR